MAYTFYLTPAFKLGGKGKQTNPALATKLYTLYIIAKTKYKFKFYKTLLKNTVSYFYKCAMLLFFWKSNVYQLLWQLPYY